MQIHLRASAAYTNRDGSDSDQVEVEVFASLGESRRCDAARQNDVAGAEPFTRAGQVIGEPGQGNKRVSQRISPIAAVDLDAIQSDNAAESRKIIPGADEVAQHSPCVP